MDIITIAGFLGSGKTSTIIELAKHLKANGLTKIAVVENEISPNGVDNLILSKHGLEVRELYAGCICCQLRNDLTETLVNLQKDYNPELIIIEPTGIATPEQVRDAVSGLGKAVNSHKVAVLVDAVRCKKPRFMVLPFITQSIAIADIVALNKCDQISSEQTTKIIEQFKELNPSAPIIPMSVTNNLNIDLLFNLLQQDFNQHRPSTQAPVKFGKEAACSLVKEISFEDKIAPELLVQIYRQLVKELATELKNLGCQEIGHIKVLCEDEGNYLKLSLTDFDEPITIQGHLESTKAIKLTVNIIVYGVTTEAVDQLLKKFV